MATTKFTGIAGPQWSDAGNWTNGVPGTGDDATLPSGIVQDIDGEDQSAVNLASLEVEPGFLGSIGSETNPLIIDAENVSHQGNGDSLYIKGTYTRYFFVSTRGRVYIHGQGASNGIFIITDGDVEIYDATIIAVVALATSSPGARLYLDSSIGLVGRVAQAGGTIINKTKIGTIANAGFLASGSFVDESEGKTHGAFIVGPGSTVHWLRSSTVDIVGLGGRFYANRNTTGFSDRKIDMIGGTLDLRNSTEFSLNTIDVLNTRVLMYPHKYDVEYH